VGVSYPNVGSFAGTVLIQIHLISEGGGNASSKQRAIVALILRSGIRLRSAPSSAIILGLFTMQACFAVYVNLDVRQPTSGALTGL
jgi:hypothetical protein